MSSQVRWTLQPALHKNLKLTDIKGYNNLSHASKCRARKRAIATLLNIRLNHVETSILPPHLIVEIWNTKVSYKDRCNFNLITEESFDGGTNFHLERKS